MILIILNDNLYHASSRKIKSYLIMQKNIELPRKTVCQWKLDEAEVTSRIIDPEIEN